MSNAAAAFAHIFASSTVETRPDWCDSRGSWRVARPDVLGHALVAAGHLGFYTTPESDAPSGAKRLWIGSRSSGCCGALLLELRSMGLKVRASRDRKGGRVVGIIVTDTGRA